LHFEIAACRSPIATPNKNTLHHRKTLHNFQILVCSTTQAPPSWRGLSAFGAGMKFSSDCRSAIRMNARIRCTSLFTLLIVAFHSAGSSFRKSLPLFNSVARVGM
jgi:hypothetical protein